MTPSPRSPAKYPRLSAKYLRWTSVLVTAIAATMVPGAARAQTPPPDPTPVDVPADEARGLAEEPGVEAEDVALFAPRAVLFVPSVVLGAVFWPLQKGLRAIERNHVLEHLEDFFYNDERTAAVLPTVSFGGGGFGLQLGARAFHEDLGGNGETGSAQALFGLNGQQVYVLSFEAERTGGTPLWLETTTAYERHPSLRFWGIGTGDGRAVGGGGHDPRTAEVESDYEHRRFRIINTAGVTLGPEDRELKLGARSRFKRHDFDRPAPKARDMRELEDAYDTSLVPGYDHGATVLEVEGLAVFDTRDQRGRTASGFYAEGFAGGALPFRDYEYARFGGELTGYFDLYRGNRVLALRAAFEAVEGEAGEIPFVELPYLGGPNRLRGYPLYRFRDEKALFGTVEYRYPIHEMVGGSLYVDVGQVAPTFADLVQEPDFKVGVGGGLILRSEDSVILTLDVAGGDGVQVYVTTDPLRAFADRDDEL